LDTAPRGTVKENRVGGASGIESGMMFER